MGIINPRPAMRRGEERKITARLAKQIRIKNAMVEDGMDAGLANVESFAIVVSSMRRRKVWLRRDEGFERMMRDFKRSEKVED